MKKRKSNVKPPKNDIEVGDYRMSPGEKKNILKVMSTNRISYGPFTREFEGAFAKAHDCRHAVFCNSGTSALHIALAALKDEHGWKDGDEVLVPAVTFIATANIVIHNKMTPVFVDVDTSTYNIDPGLIEDKITAKTRAVIPVHLLGLTADMDPILEIASRKGLSLIEDACETPFARYKGRKVGSMGDIGCFSTYMAHYIMTGVGGLALTNRTALAVRLRSLMNHGRDAIYYEIDQGKGVSEKKRREIVAKRFSFVSMGHSFRATEFEAALGAAQMKNKDAAIKARRANARLLSQGLKDLDDVIQLPTIPEGFEHMFMMYPIALREGGKKGLVNFLEDHRIRTRELLPVINQPIYRKLFGDLESRYRVARWLNRCAFYIGCHPYMTREDIAYVVDRVHAFFGR